MQSGHKKNTYWSHKVLWDANCLYTGMHSAIGKYYQSTMSSSKYKELSLQGMQTQCSLDKPQKPFQDLGILTRILSCGGKEDKK